MMKKIRVADGAGAGVYTYRLFFLFPPAVALVPRVVWWWGKFVSPVSSGPKFTGEWGDVLSPSLQLVWLDFSFFLLLLLLLWVLCQTKKFPSFHSRNWAREESRAPWALNRFHEKKKTWRRGIQICNIRLKFWLKRERERKKEVVGYTCWILFFIFKYWWLNFEKRRYAASTTGEVL